MANLNREMLNLRGREFCDVCNVTGAGCHCMSIMGVLIKQVCPLYPFSVMRYLSRHTFHLAFNIVRSFILCTISKAVMVSIHPLHSPW